MIYFLPNHTETEAQLRKARGLITNPENWIKKPVKKGNSYCANGACFEAGVYDIELPDSFSSDDPNYYRGDLERGSIPEAFWFLRLALSILTQGDYDNVGRFNDAPETQREDVLMLFNVALALLKVEAVTPSEGALQAA